MTWFAGVAAEKQGPDIVTKLALETMAEQMCINRQKPLYALDRSVLRSTNKTNIKRCAVNPADVEHFPVQFSKDTGAGTSPSIFAFD